MEVLKNITKKNHQSLFKKLNLKIQKLKSKKKSIKLSFPFSIKDILEFDNNFNQVKSNITYPSMRYLLKTSNSGQIEFESPIDILLMALWTPIGNKLIYFLSFLVGSFIIFGLGSYVYKLIKLKSLEVYQFKKLSSEFGLLEQDNLNNLKLIEEYSQIVNNLNTYNKNQIDNITTQTLSKVKREQKLYILQVILSITVSCLSFGLYYNINNQDLLVFIINYLKNKINPEEKTSKYLEYIVTGIINNIDKQIMKKLKNTNQIISLWDPINNQVNDNSLLDQEIENLINQDLSIKENKEKIKKYLLKIDNLEIRQKRYQELKKIMKESKNRMSGGYFGFSTCFFTAYQGIFSLMGKSNLDIKNNELSPIRTLWQDQDIFFVNGNKNINISNIFYRKKLKVNKNSLYLVQRVKNVKKISIMNNEYQILTNYNFDQQHNCLYKSSDKNKMRPIIEIIMNINDGQLLIPLKITNCGLFLNGLSQKMFDKKNMSKNQQHNQQIEYPNPDFINQLPSIYQQITTIVPIKKIEEISTINTQNIKNQIMKKIE